MDRECMIETFENKGIGANIRVIDRNGEPWFVAKDVASALGYVRTADAVREHCKGVGEMETPSAGGKQIMKIIPEADLFRLIMHSKLPQAEAFQDWVVEVVLPSIRKHGAYMTPKTIDDMMADPRAFAELFKRAADEQDRRLLAEDKIRYLTPKVPFGTISESNGRPRESLVKPYYRSGWCPVRTTTITEWQRTLFDLD